MNLCLLSPWAESMSDEAHFVKNDDLLGKESP